jgi:hypothetical protein
MFGGASASDRGSSTIIGGTCAASASNTSAALSETSDATEGFIGASTEWDSDTDVKRAKRDAISDMTHAHKESNHSMILHGGERKGRLKHALALFGFPMSDNRMLTQDALKGDKGLYDGTDGPLGL